MKWRSGLESTENGEEDVWPEGPLDGPCPPIALRSQRCQDKFLFLFQFIQDMPVKLGFYTRCKSSFEWQDCLQSTRVSVVKSLRNFSVALTGDAGLLTALVGFVFQFLLLELFCFLEVTITAEAAAIGLALSCPNFGLLLVYLGFWEIIAERAGVCDDEERGRTCELLGSACCELRRWHGWSPVCFWSCQSSHSCSGPNTGRGY